MDMNMTNIQVCLSNKVIYLFCLRLLKVKLQGCYCEWLFWSSYQKKEHGLSMQNGTSMLIKLVYFYYLYLLVLITFIYYVLYQIRTLFLAMFNCAHR